MKTAEQNNIDTVTAFIGNVSNRGHLDRTDQFFAEQMREAFTDRHYEVDEILAQGEKVVARIIITAAHTGTFAGIAPTGKPVKITQFREFRVADGIVADHSGWFDTGMLLPQLQAR